MPAARVEDGIALASGPAEWLVRHPVVAIVLIAVAQQVLTLGARDLWWSDEVRQIAVLQELLERGHWIALRLNDIPYPDKPPLYFWFLGGLAALFGSTAPPVVFLGLAVTHLFFLFCVFAMARMMSLDRATALTAVLVLSTLNYLLFLSHYARMDFMFAGFIALAWGFFWKAARDDAPGRAMICGFVAVAAASMTKGPFGFLLPVAALVVFLVWQRRPGRLLSRDVGFGLLIVAAAVAAWIAGIALAESPDYVRYIFSDQIVGRAARNADNPFNYILYLVLLPALFLPWTVVLPARRIIGVETVQPGELLRRSYLWSAVMGGLVVMSLVGEKHDYYLLPLFAPLALLVADRLHGVTWDRLARIWPFIAGVVAVVGLLLPIVPAFLPYPISMAGVILSSLVLLATALAIFGLRHEGLGPALAALVVGQTIWINILVILVLPSLDPVMSPQNLVQALRPYVDSGYSPATYAMTGGDLAYHLDSTYREGFRDLSDFGAWLRTQPNSVVATPVAAWRTLPPGRFGLREATRVGLAGDTIVIGLKGRAP